MDTLDQFRSRTNMYHPPMRRRAYDMFCGSLATVILYLAALLANT